MGPNMQQQDAHQIEFDRINLTVFGSNVISLEKIRRE